MTRIEALQQMLMEAEAQRRAKHSIICAALPRCGPIDESVGRPVKVDLPLGDLKTLGPVREEPEDFADVWSASLSEHGLEHTSTRRETERYRPAVKIFDLMFASCTGQPIRMVTTPSSDHPGDGQLLVKYQRANGATDEIHP